MKKQENGWSAMDGKIFSAYIERFGGDNICSFSAPPLTGKQFDALWRKALETGIEVDYIAAGWDDPATLPEGAVI